jgi:hypothetical protein
MPNYIGGWYIINPPPIKNNNKIYEILFGGLKYNSYLCIVSEDIETGSANSGGCRG